MRKFIAVGLGAVFTLLVFELVLRMIGFQELYSRDTSRPQRLSERPVVLFLGNSHTMGTGAPVGKSYPDQFRDLLVEQYGDSPFEVINLGRGNANSSYVADEAQGYLKSYRPKFVVVMTGETNFWNHLGYSDFVSKTSSEARSIGLLVYNAAYSLRTFRFIQLFSEFVIRPRAGQKLFSDYNETDRAWIWVAAMNNANMFDSSKMSEAEAWDAYDTIKSYTSAGGLPLSMLEALIEILPRVWKDRPELEEEWRSRILEYEAMFGVEGYSYYLDRLTNTYLSSVKDTVVRELGNKMLARRPSNFADLREVFEFQQEANSHRTQSLESQIKFYSLATIIFPTHAHARMFLFAKLRQANRFAEAFEVAKQGMELNPLANQSNWMIEIRAVEEDARREGSERSMQLVSEIEKYREEFVRRFPRHRGRVVKITDEEILKWVEFDLERIRNVVEQSGAKLMLQTYPPERQGPEKLVDQLIRKFAAQHGVPVSDTSREIMTLEPDFKKREAYFTKMYGDYDGHLGENGYAIVARLLKKDFEKLGWLQGDFKDAK